MAGSFDREVPRVNPTYPVIEGEFVEIPHDPSTTLGRPPMPAAVGDTEAVGQLDVGRLEGDPVKVSTYPAAHVKPWVPPQELRSRRR